MSYVRKFSTPFLLTPFLLSRWRIFPNHPLLLTPLQLDTWEYPCIFVHMWVCTPISLFMHELVYTSICSYVYVSVHAWHATALDLSVHILVCMSVSPFVARMVDTTFWVNTAQASKFQTPRQTQVRLRNSWFFYFA